MSVSRGTLVVLFALSVAACSSTPGASARSDVSAKTLQGITTTNISVGHVYTLQAGDVCTEHGAVTITSVEPVLSAGRIVVTDWGTRSPHSPYFETDSDPAGAQVGLQSLHGFSKKPIDVPCSGPISTYYELDIEMRARTDVAMASGFRVHYGHGRSFLVAVFHGMCTSAASRAKRCPDVPS